MTTQEIKELMRVRGEQYCPRDLHFQCDDNRCAAHKSWREGHASATDTLAECLSLALECMKINARDLATLHPSHTKYGDLNLEPEAVGARFLKETITAIKAKLKGDV